MKEMTIKDIRFLMAGSNFEIIDYDSWETILEITGSAFTCPELKRFYSWEVCHIYPKTDNTEILHDIKTSGPLGDKLCAGAYTRMVVEIRKPR